MRHRYFVEGKYVLKPVEGVEGSKTTLHQVRRGEEQVRAPLPTAIRKGGVEGCGGCGGFEPYFSATDVSQHDPPSRVEIHSAGLYFAKNPPHPPLGKTTFREKRVM
jgi:hypothetical protein